MHAVMESHLVKPLFIPDHYIAQHRQARVSSPYTVIPLSREAFMDWKNCSLAPIVRESIKYIFHPWSGQQRVRHDGLREESRFAAGC